MMIDIICLATALYFEARGEPLEGQVAVANVIINRMYDERYPDTICGVVQQGPTYAWTDDFPVRDRCQFSYYCDGKSDEPSDTELFEQLISVATASITGRFIDVTDGATHYHATYILPSWAESKTHTITIGNHAFYRWEPSTTRSRELSTRERPSSRPERYIGGLQ